MNISKQGLDLIKKHEQFRNHAYKPVPWEKGWTIGYGNKFYEDGTPVQKGDYITLARGKTLYKNIVSQFEDKIRFYVNKQLEQYQWDALVSFAYNVGTEAFKNSTLLKVINKNPTDFEEIKRQFLRWNKSSGKVLKGLVKRRNQEYWLYSQGVREAVKTFNDG